MSAILTADTLNDFISPAVACIKPVESFTHSAPPSSSDPFLEHEVIIGGQQHQQQQNQPAQISLTDCLACSGCVTSAEAVLVSLQSHNEVLSTLDSAPSLRLVRLNPATEVDYVVTGLENFNARLFVASVSPQTRASFAATFGPRITERQAGWMIEALLAGDSGLRAGGQHGNGFQWVLDTNAAREATLVLGADEALRLGKARRQVQPQAPILTSSCPGWVCYAEKTHPYVLPHLSRVKSPQALMGTLVKTSLSRALGIPPERIWHLAVMPCFDKKLEASREELTDAVWAADGKPGQGIRDVDCVITSKEVLMLAEARGIDFFGLSHMPPPEQVPYPEPVIHEFLFPPRKMGQLSRAAGTSGGNLHFILEHVRARHAGSEVKVIPGRLNVVEYVVTSPTGETLFKAARYYGFRNIQNLVRKLKSPGTSRMPGAKPFGSARRLASKSTGGSSVRDLAYNYVEVMACPGGCTDGGGQFKVDDPIVMERKGLTSKPSPDEQKRWLAQVDEAYFSSGENDFPTGGSDNLLVNGISPSRIRDILVHWAGMMGVDLERLVYTSFREVVSDVGKNSQMTDTERIVRLAGQTGGGW